MKLLRNIVSILAMVMVLLLGAVPAHADQTGHAHHAASQISEVSSEAGHPGVQEAADRHGDAAIHCGAPILGPEPVSVPCSLTVATVVYFAGDLPRSLGVAAQELRPPRR